MFGINNLLQHLWGLFLTVNLPQPGKRDPKELSRSGWFVSDYFIEFLSRVSQCIPDWPGACFVDRLALNSHDYANICLLSGGTKGVCHHALPLIVYSRGETHPGVGGAVSLAGPWTALKKCKLSMCSQHMCIHFSLRLRFCSDLPLVMDCSPKREPSNLSLSYATLCRVLVMGTEVEQLITVTM